MTKLIHQTWIDANPPELSFHPDWRRSWASLNPGWEYRLWTDADLFAFVQTEFPDFFPVWCAYPKAIMRVDAWRYLLLKRVGGLYADLDFACLRPLDEWLREDSRFACADQGDGALCNAFMWAPQPGLPFFDRMEEGLIERSHLGDPLGATGPNFLSHYCRGESAFTLLATNQVYPVPYWDKKRLERLRAEPLEKVTAEFPDAGAITFWSHSWAGQGNTTPKAATSPSVAKAKSGSGQLLVAVFPSRSEDDLRSACEASWAAAPSRPAGIEVRFIDQENPPADGEAAITASDLSCLARRVLAEQSANWLFVCQDNCYVALERLLELADEQYAMIGNEALVTRGEPDARAGYLLSKAALVALAADEDFASQASATSVLLPCLRQAGLKWQATHRLRPDTGRVPSRFNDLISTSGCNPDWMTVTHTLVHDEPLRVAPVAHPDWQDQLAFYDNGLFARGEGISFGVWDEDSGGSVLLKWFGWSPEVLIPMRDDRGDFTGSALVVKPKVANFVLAAQETPPPSDEKPLSPAEAATAADLEGSTQDTPPISLSPAQP